MGVLIHWIGPKVLLFASLDLFLVLGLFAPCFVIEHNCTRFFKWTWDLNDHLYVLGSVGSVARPFQWDFETAEIVEQAEDRIAIEADVSLVESWRDTLVLVREDGIWRLTDSYYAKQE